MSGPEVLIPVSFFLSVASVFILRGPLGKAIAESIRRAPPWSDVSPPNVDTERLLGELEELTHRLDELEERQDFTERLLAQQRERPAVGPGH